MLASKIKLNIGKHASSLPSTDMAHCRRPVKAIRHFVRDHCHNLVDFTLSGSGKS